MSGEYSKGADRKDLFGNPWADPKDPRGRKRHKRDAQVAETIAVLRAGGSSVEAIAATVGLSEPTLRKYYLGELTDGPAQAKAFLDQVMWRKALDGNVSAARLVYQRFQEGDASVPVARQAARAVPAPPPPTREEKLGKKASADRDAQTAHEGTEWGQLLN